MRDLRCVESSDVIRSEEWAVRNHPDNFYYGVDIHGNECVHKGSHITDPTKSMHVGRSLVKGRSKKGKFVRDGFVYTNEDTDTKLDAPIAPKYRQPAPMIVASRHAGTPIKTRKHIRLSQRTR